MIKARTVLIIAVFMGSYLFIPLEAALPSLEIKRDEERQHQLQTLLQPERESHLFDVDLEERRRQRYQLPRSEAICFEIDSIDLEGDDIVRFKSSLRRTLQRVQFESGNCLGAEGINLIMVETQNDIIRRGYTTTRIVAAPQDLKKGELTLTVLPGYVRTISFSDPEYSHLSRVLKNAFPLKEGDLLNLHQIEQGLENMKRVPTADADIQIAPAEKLTESDLLVEWKSSSFPYRFTFNVDNSGTKATGRYQGSVTFSADNPLGMNDLFYFSYNHDLGGSNRVRDENGKSLNGKTDGYALHYSIPYANWLFSVNKSQYSYDQGISGATEVYSYRGNSQTADLTLTRLLYRDARRKTSVSGQFWFRKSSNFVNDQEIEVQRRRAAGWKLMINHKEYFRYATLDMGLSYRRGTGLYNALEALEDEYDEGTSRMKIITADINLYAPFRFKEHNFSYQGNLRIQWNKTRLLSQDMFSIGGRYSVRGFDGEMSLMADRGWYLQNTVAWSYKANHQLYIGIDAGHISGRSLIELSGKSLVGGVVGMRGQFNRFGTIYYDVFVGAPIKKPRNFKTSSATIGFNLSYSF